MGHFILTSIVDEDTIKNANVFVLIVLCLRSHQRKIFSQDTFEVLFTDVIFQYSFDSPASVWYFMLLNIFLWLAYLSLDAVSLTP